VEDPQTGDGSGCRRSRSSEGQLRHHGFVLHDFGPSSAWGGPSICRRRRSRVPLLDRLLVGLALRHLVGGLEEDYAVLEMKRCLREPLISSADGPLLEMRRWFEQFYPAVALPRGRGAGADAKPG